MNKRGRNLLFTGVFAVTILTSSIVLADTKVIVVPMGGAVGDATAEDVVKGKTFSSKTGKGLAGTLELPPTMQTYSTPTYGMTFNRIPAGTFTMGSWAGVLGGIGAEPGRDLDEIQHQVTLTNPFYMQTTEVTQQQWRDVIVEAEAGGYLSVGILNEEPSTAHAGVFHASYPVETVSWTDVVDWINALNQLTGKKYSLPTEAQWEYAARATTINAYANPYGFNSSDDETGGEFNSNLDAMGWYRWNNTLVGGYPSGTKPVARKQANRWGLHDMHGNVQEWCQDWYGGYSGDVTDPQGPTTGHSRILRGGGWLSSATSARSASRSIFLPGSSIIFSSNHVGFRLVLPADQ